MPAKAGIHSQSNLLKKLDSRLHENDEKALLRTFYEFIKFSPAMHASVKIRDIKNRLRQYAAKEKAEVLKRFFKTGPGEYGEGDKFLGVVVPDIRRVAREFRDAPIIEITRLLQSPWHEERMLALLLLVERFGSGDETMRGAVYSLYLENTSRINSWDLVDISAPHIVGAHLLGRSKRPLYALSRSQNLWERRIAVVATFAFIRANRLAESFAIIERCLCDKEDLIHKAAGWMLREAGKRDEQSLEGFLQKHYQKMPRTMLRYAIERFPEAKRKKYLRGLLKSTTTKRSASE